MAAEEGEAELGLLWCWHLKEEGIVLGSGRKRERGGDGLCECG